MGKKSSIEELKRLIQNQRHTVGERIQALNEAEVRLNENYKHLQARIRSGQSTGDPIRDFVLQENGRIDELIESLYREVDMALRKYAGQVFLLVYQERVCIRHVMMPSPGNENAYEWREHFLAGLLHQDRLVFSRPKHRKRGKLDCSFPTDGYLLQRQNGSLGRIQGQAHEHTEVKRAFLGKLASDRRYQPDSDSIRRMSSRLIVGDAAVNGWFAAHGFDVTADIVKAEFAKKS